MEWILLATLVVVFTFYYSYRQKQEARRERERKSFEEAMARQSVETIEVKDIVAEEPKGLAHTRDGVVFLALPLRASSGSGPGVVIVFGKKAEQIAPKIHRGTRIRATGRPVTRTQANREGTISEKVELIASRIELIGEPHPEPPEEENPV